MSEVLEGVKVELKSQSNLGPSAQAWADAGKALLGVFDEERAAPRTQTGGSNNLQPPYNNTPVAAPGMYYQPPRYCPCCGRPWQGYSVPLPDYRPPYYWDHIPMYAAQSAGTLQHRPQHYQH